MSTTSITSKLDQPATIRDLQMLESRIDKKFHDLEVRLEAKIDAKIDAAVKDIANIISQFAEQVNQRFELIEHRLDVMSADINILKARQDKFQKDLDRLTQAVGFN